MSDETDDGFLGRWSRRKRAVAHAANAASAASAAQEGERQMPLAAVEPQPGSSADGQPDDRPRDPETGALIDPMLVEQLPAIADIAQAGDLSGFLNTGVPEALRREALRAAWAADPMISSYVSPALDYAYDYNTPGAVHGFGPLSATDLAEAQAFIGRVFSDPPPERPVPDESLVADAVSDLSEYGDIMPHMVVHDEPNSVRMVFRQPSSASLQIDAHAVVVANDAAAGRTESVELQTATASDAASRADGEGLLFQPRRRGGGATPV